MAETNVDLIKKQKLIIAIKDAEIDSLKNDLLFSNVQRDWYKNSLEEQDIFHKENSERWAETLSIWKENLIAFIEQTKMELEEKNRQIEMLSRRPINLDENENSANFPKELSDLFTKMTTDSCHCMDYEAFKTELLKRLRCKICVSEVEGLRCSQCLQVICKGCYTNVAFCPNCRNQKKNFQPIIMPRL